MYFVVITAVVFHELFHVIAAKLLHLKVLNVTIGRDFLQLKLGNLYFSPFVLGGYVDVDEEQLFERGGKGIVFFYASGVIANIIIVFIATLMTNNLVKYWTIIFNVCMIALNIIPIFQNNDGKMIIKCCKEYK